jgi:hypothetical protein
METGGVDNRLQKVREGKSREAETVRMVSTRKARHGTLDKLHGLRGIGLSSEKLS